MSNFVLYGKNFLSFLFFLFLFGINQSLFAISITDNPLFLVSSTPPNVVMTLDDSGSMGWGYVPDAFRSVQSRIDGPKFSTATYNSLYYNPYNTYVIPKRTDGKSYTTSYKKAFINGFNTAYGYADLSGGSSTLFSPNQNGYRTIVEYFNNKQSDCTGNANTSHNTSSCRISRNTVSYVCSANFNKKVLTVSDCGDVFAGGFSPDIGSNIKITGASGSNNKEYSVVSIVNGKKLNVDVNFTSETKSGVSISWSKPVSVGYYHLYYKDKSGAVKPSGCDDNKETDSCYIRIEVGGSEDVADPSVDGSSLSERQKQNFANWYSFYRTRNLSTISSSIQSISLFKNNEVRLAWQSLSSCNSFGTACTTEKHENRIRPLDGYKSGSTSITHRTDFYNWIEKLPVSGSTPLRAAMIKAGEYFKKNGKDSPYAEDPYFEVGTQLSCRKNFHVMFTDGYYNDSDNDVGLNNVDNSDMILPDGKKYTPRIPFKDNSSKSLADIAFHYWASDLNQDVDNNVSSHFADRSGTEDDQYWNPKNNPATWQHMINFTIGLGLTSSLTKPEWTGSTYSGGYAEILSGAQSWPSISTESNRVYDLWHAAINSRGQFFSAESPNALNNAFLAVMESILGANPSASALAANSTSIQTGTLIFQAKFDSNDWHGQLVAYPVQSGGKTGTQQWDASSLIPSHSARNIYTYNGSSGKSFSSCSASLNADQKNYLDRDAYGVKDNKCSARLNWLRGDSSQEQRNGGGFRNRSISVLGDIINSDPVYVKNEDYGYASESSALSAGEKSLYLSFLKEKSARIPVVYVGSNDGMLHAFRADIGNINSGREIFSYIPYGVYHNLNKLTNPAYSHKYFVDGAPSAKDAYLNGWKTILLGGLGAGGKTIYALDVTAPESFSASHVMWEFSDEDLGYTFSQPQIGRLSNGQWVAIFGNGYNSSTERSYLYVVNLSNGSLIKKIPAGVQVNNGLSTPYLYDFNDDKVIDYVYAGDLQGNMWKFDLSSSSSASWSVSYGGQPLFVAKNSNGQIQPITSQPKVSKHPDGGYMVYFGTGIYLADGDAVSKEVQSFYAIRDNVIGTITRLSLQQQSITHETNEFGYWVRQTSKNSVDWAGGKKGWYIDFVTPPIPGVANGERIISAPLLKYDRVIFVTMTPYSDPCKPGGESWLMELDMISGAPTVISVFDFNNDGNFDANDLLRNGNTASGIKSTVGITKTPIWLDGSCTGNYCTGFKELSGTTGNIMTINNRGKTPSSGLPTRVFWRQIF